VRSCHGIGKTFTVSRAVSWWVATHPPDDTRVVTGHGPETQIGFERENNPFVGA